jgi:hypothetical protein
MPSASFAIVPEYLIPDMLLKPVGWFSPIPYYIFAANSDYTLDFIGSSASAGSVTVSTSAVVSPYPNVPLTAVPSAYQLKFRTVAAPSQVAFNMSAADINLTSVRLSYDLARLTFSRSPQRPDATYEAVQAVRQTAGGVLLSYDQIITKQLIRLKLRLTTAEKEALLVFFDSSAVGMANAFTYTNTAGVATSVRFDSPRLDGLLEKAYNTWELTVGLRVVT